MKGVCWELSQNHMSLKTFIILSCYFLPAGVAYAQAPSPSQALGGQMRQQEDVEKSRRLEKKIQEPIEKASSEEEPQTPINESSPKIYIKDIRIEGAKLLSNEEVRLIVSAFEDRELNFAQMQQIADRITDLYRKKGYITSRAYLPVQSIRNNVLVIRVLEVKSGSVEIRGNRYSKTERLRKDLNVVPGGYFDFSALQQSLVYINEHPDRQAKAVLVPGKIPGTTDMIIEVAERRPFHVGFEYDNYGSRYLDYHRYSLVLEHNNLFGFDDLLYIKGQMSPDSRMSLQQMRYLFPITQRWDLGFYAVNTDLKLGEEFDILDAEGHAQIFGVFASRRLIRDPNMDLRLNLGFDYKRVRNKILGTEISEDNLRVFRAGLDADFEDPLGRNILAVGIDSGVPDILGGSESKDPHASRAGSGGRFDKGNFTYYRLQPTPFETAVLWKNIGQYSNHNLPASEQFQMGGALSVRGYPPAEHSGDTGIYSALELSLPIYPLSQNVKVPFTRDEKLYDSLRFVIFYDIATAHLNNPLVGEEEDETLRGYGAGLRLNVRDDVTCRIEVGFPHGRTPSDGDRVHPWIEFTARY